MTTEPRRVVLEALARSKKYRHTCADTLERITEWALARHPNPKNAVKAAKRKLHQVCGAFFDQLDLDHVERSLDAPDTDTPDLCRRVLERHASTAERLDIMADVFPNLFEATGTPRRVLDLACGLNPFALPWMGLADDTSYLACDVDHRLIRAVNALFARLGTADRMVAQCRDVLVAPPDAEADVALLLKTLPCLERQEKGAARRVIHAVRAPRLVVSFPARSLGGKDKGMVRHYDDFLSGLLGQGIELHRKLEYSTETFYVLSKQG